MTIMRIEDESREMGDSGDDFLAPEKRRRDFAPVVVSSWPGKNYLQTDMSYPCSSPAFRGKTSTAARTTRYLA